MKRLALSLFLALLVSAPAHASVVGWGENQHGELGAGFKSAPQPPTTTLLPAGVKEVSAAIAANVALMEDGTVRSWGGNAIGQLGIGAVSEGSLVPVQVPGLTNVKQVAMSGSHAMALLPGGTVQVWGSNLYGELGNGTSTHGKEQAGDNAPSPQPVPGLSGVVAIAAGGPDDVALLANGTVVAWGDNSEGQLGDGTTIEKDVPTRVTGLSNVKSIAMGAFPAVGGHMLAVLENGTVMAVGRNDQGQLGDGTTTSSSLPVPVKGLSGVTAVSADVSHSLALTLGGTVYSWGGNTYGQLGIGSGPEHCGTAPCARTPRPVRLREVSAISAGFRYSVAISAGKPFSWGWNIRQELGDGTTVTRFAPVPALELNEATSVSAGWYHTQAILNGPGPPTPIEVTAGPGSLTVNWLGAEEPAEWTVCWRPITSPKSEWSTGVKLPPSARGYTVTGLLPGQPYEVKVQNLNFGSRIVHGTPLEAPVLAAQLIAPAQAPGTAQAPLATQGPVATHGPDREIPHNPRGAPPQHGKVARGGD